jgi:uncharacterized membrane protein YphA (DoxX/SURF4 family)
MNRALWIVQGLLSPLFLFAGSAKLAMPLDEMVAQTGLPGPFLIFISVAEILGGLGLILPMLLKIRPSLTPLAAAGLAVIMIGATAMSAVMVDMASAIFPLVVGILAAFVAYGRSRPAPRRRPQAIRQNARHSLQQAA